ncbi:hypothetical protein BJ875DRAFT_150846 [Amylocarpus encephaloides]|uniref:RAD52 homolog n=1 Tax=Amylocarpus encephaloides TaxID=45428 RepID=A0A9P8C330_9HELO|nr:hypothetical protein BJ875DRAFT_150846 [Amylocarpus encephaloides]
MPAPGEQHNPTSGGRVITNPFEEVKPRISEYTAVEIATLQFRLEKQLGPEYISSRPGAGGQKVHYLAAEKCIQLANEVFGFNGWSSSIKELQVDFVDEHPQSGKVSLGLSVIVRVTLRDGTFHEDIGYGHIENCKGKAAAFEKAKKEGTTDALKRALRSFGNLLGNCIYDKEYLQKVTKVKAHPTKWDVDNLHRHPSFAAVKKEQQVVKPTESRLAEEKSQNGSGPSLISEDTFDEDFGDFDEADFAVGDPEAHPDEVVLPEPAASHHLHGRNGNDTRPQNHQRPPVTGAQSMAAPPGRPQNGAPSNTNNVNNAAQPPTPNAGFSKSINSTPKAMRPPQEPGPQSRLAPQGQPLLGVRRTLNQPSRNGVGSAPVSPARLNPPVNLNINDIESLGLPPQGTGFFSARGIAEVVGKDGNANPDEDPNNGPPAPIPSHVAAFDLQRETSIRRTPGVDHKSSKHVGRDGKHVPASQTPVRTTGNIVNPQLDATRRIGAPNSPSPMANRNSYKPPSKRPVDSRAPLVDLPANGAIGQADLAGDAKRQRMNG